NSAQHADKIAELVAQTPHLADMLTESNGVQILSGFYNPEMWVMMQLVIGGFSAVMAVLAIIGISRKDNIKYFGLGEEQKVGFKDYVDVLAHNRGIQMLVVSASTDKLASSTKSNTTVMVCLWGIVFGNYAMYSSNSAITTIPILILTLFLMNKVACKMGQKKALLMGTYGSMICAVVSCILIVFGANKGIMQLPVFSLTKPSTFAGLFMPSNWSMLGLVWVIVAILMGAFNNMAGNIVIPMTADCADYEVYRTGRYVPGLMGTLFSFVDKLISSLASTFVALTFSAIGFKEVLPTVETPFSNGILIATIVCFLGFPMIGWLCNIISMHFYPLTKEKMAEIQDEIARIKNEQAQAKA
ncbi:MAG: MFS transporter, partial [Gemmiger sp.]